MFTLRLDQALFGRAVVIVAEERARSRMVIHVRVVVLAAGKRRVGAFG